MNTEKLIFSNLIPSDFDWLVKSYQHADSFDLDGYASILADDVSFQMGNNPKVSGKKEILENVSNFWASISSMNHNFINVFSVENTIILEANIDYFTKKGSLVSIPCVTIIQRDKSGLATSNRVYLDMQPLFN